MGNDSSKTESLADFVEDDDWKGKLEDFFFLPIFFSRFSEAAPHIQAKLQLATLSNDALATTNRKPDNAKK